MLRLNRSEQKRTMIGFIKLSFPCQVCQYVNEGAAAVGGSVGWHLAGKKPPLGTHIALPGHVAEEWEERREGGLFVSSSGCQRDHSDLLQERASHWQNSWSQNRLFNQQRTAGDVITITSLVFFSKENHIKSASCMCLAGSTGVFWWNTPLLGRLWLLQILTFRRCKGFPHDPSWLKKTTRWMLNKRHQWGI